MKIFEKPEVKRHFSGIVSILLDRSFERFYKCLFLQAKMRRHFMEKRAGRGRCFLRLINSQVRVLYEHV